MAYHIHVHSTYLSIEKVLTSGTQYPLPIIATQRIPVPLVKTFAMESWWESWAGHFVEQNLTRRLSPLRFVHTFTENDAHQSMCAAFTAFRPMEASFPRDPWTHQTWIYMWLYKIFCLTYELCKHFQKSTRQQARHSISVARILCSTYYRPP